MRRRARQHRVAEHAHGDGGNMPARCRKPAEEGMFRRFFVQMMRLRIEFAREFEDFFLGHSV